MCPDAAPADAAADVSPLGSAHATAGNQKIAAPTPNDAAKAPTRPACVPHPGASFLAKGLRAMSPLLSMVGIIE
ncbi:hypothetical protein MCHLDSM_06098 [Mycolicibacterium chlorophenolicum]|uniref:Uncharacterized protein n=1 Tax=Mycolicibacterium chlorophenolicum TaxID=37916 RepID=A0A0J6VG39_9MYCO|nr:hypothetical protein MCHLDSM_06098 [Mycolicibacterium chlorophenolicum]